MYKNSLLQIRTKEGRTSQFEIGIIDNISVVEEMSSPTNYKTLISCNQFLDSLKAFLMEDTKPTPPEFPPDRIEKYIEPK